MNNFIAAHKNLENKKVLLIGQVLVGRTETLEDYLIPRTGELVVVAISNTHSPKNYACCSRYLNGKKVRNFSLPSILIGKSCWWKRPFFVFSYIVSFLSVILSVLYLRKKYDLVIGIGGFPMFSAMILKKIHIAKSLVYYCIDYFMLPSCFNFDYLIIKLLTKIDAQSIKDSDFVWHISPYIADAREKITGIKKDSYKSLNVPLGFSSSLLRSSEFDKVDKKTLVFVGSSGQFHGLELILEALPLVVKTIPDIKFKILGVGPWDDFKKLVKDSNLEKYFIFRGFIEGVNELFDEVSLCACGLALYAQVPDNPAIYADPGKPKLYAFCGLPVIITKLPYVAREIEVSKAGCAISCTKDELSNAILSILNCEDDLKTYRENATRFAKSCISESIFDHAFEMMHNVKVDKIN